ncbi:hypothetical protein MSAN_02117200 [Mycena sanguinolenta]|uniref:F-box domain-containing protein n=1 Tax=Mycena sanguinolenta TaxID=230812 RepID=A0A8H6XH06_9AGAR|nr:hypothetical protein MSAN_02117200 [Mycena sanguinolenta]
MVLTRRAHRERMEISRWLPNEILVHIIQHSAKADQATLARVSKLFHALCLPILYRVVEFKDPHSTTVFCSGIIENPSRADAVRSFVLDVPYQYCCDMRDDLVLASLKLMSRLDHLSFSEFTFDYRHGRILLEEINFLQLTSCNIWVPDDLIYRFPAQASDLSVRVSLPHLEFYHGGAAFVSGIDAICLKEVQLTWYSADDANVDKIVTSLSSMTLTKPHLPFVSCHAYWGGPCHQIMDSVSMRMPHTKTLRLHPMRDYGALLSQDTILHATECLPQFTGLLYLAMEWSKGAFPTSGADKHKDRIAVEGWGEACPTLEACCLNHSGWRKVDGRWEEYPIKKFWALAGLCDLGY